MYACLLINTCYVLQANFHHLVENKAHAWVLGLGVTFRYYYKGLCHRRAERGKIVREEGGSDAERCVVHEQRAEHKLTQSELPSASAEKFLDLLLQHRPKRCEFWRKRQAAPTDSGFFGDTPKKIQKATPHTRVASNAVLLCSRATTRVGDRTLCVAIVRTHPWNPMPSRAKHHVDQTRTWLAASFAVRA